MAILSNTYLTYSTIGIQEDVENIIYNVDPYETPFYSMAAKIKAYNTLHEWQTDTLPSAADNFQLEGDVFAALSVAATTRLGNYCQISDKVLSVSDTDLYVRKYGRSTDEMAYLIIKYGKALKNDIETGLIGTNKAKVSGNSTTARKYASILSWIGTNTSKGSGGADPSPLDGTSTRTDGTQRTFTESLLKDVLQSIYTNSNVGQELYIFLPPALRREMGTFNGGNTRFIEMNGVDMLNTSYDVYKSDWGHVTIVTDRFMRARDALILNMDFWKIAELRPIYIGDIAKTADSEQKFMITELTLVAANEKASGIVADLS